MHQLTRKEYSVSNEIVNDEPRITVHKIVRNWRHDTHLEFTLWFRTVEGRTAWKNGVVGFELFETAEGQIEHVMRHQTPFVKANWFRLEVMVPNRDRHGNIQPGYIQDIGVILATREGLAAQRTDDACN